MIWKEFLYMEGSGDFFIVMLFIGSIYLAQLKEEGVLAYHKQKLAICLYYHVYIILFKQELKRGNRRKIRRLRQQLKREVKYRIYRARKEQWETAEKYHRDMAA